METMLTPGQAWQDFYAYIKEKKKNGTMPRIPGEIQEAQYAFDGRRRNGLGNVRIMRLLERYAPERYRVEFNFILIR